MNVQVRLNVLLNVLSPSLEFDPKEKDQAAKRYSKPSCPLEAAP